MDLEKNTIFLEHPVLKLIKTIYLLFRERFLLSLSSHLTVFLCNWPLPLHFLIDLVWLVTLYVVVLINALSYPNEYMYVLILPALSLRVQK